MGALTATGIPSLRAPFEPLPAGGCHVPNTNIYRLPEGYGADEPRRGDRATASSSRDPSTVAAIILEPVQNAGGCFVPPEGYFQRVREICDEYDVLFISDEVICSWGRLGEWFGAQRYDYQPDIITTAKGITSRVRADGRGDRLRPRLRAVLEGTASFTHGFTFGGHPICCRRGAGQHRRSSRTRASSSNVRAQRAGASGAMLDVAARHPDRRRRARRRLLPGASSWSRTRRPRSLQRRGVRDAAARLPLAASSSSAA